MQKVFICKYLQVRVRVCVLMRHDMTSASATSGTSFSSLIRYGCNSVDVRGELGGAVAIMCVHVWWNKGTSRRHFSPQRTHFPCKTLLTRERTARHRFKHANLLSRTKPPTRAGLSTFLWLELNEPRAGSSRASTWKSVEANILCFYSPLQFRGCTYRESTAIKRASTVTWCSYRSLKMTHAF